jgi:hypothetical protein
VSLLKMLVTYSKPLKTFFVTSGLFPTRERRAPEGQNMPVPCIDLKSMHSLGSCIFRGNVLLG